MSFGIARTIGLIAIALLSALAGQGCLAAGAEPDRGESALFVAPDGDDANPGTKARPLATLTGDRRKVVQAMAVSPMVANKDIVEQLTERLLEANSSLLPQFRNLR